MEMPLHPLLVWVSDGFLVHSALQVIPKGKIEKTGKAFSTPTRSLFVRPPKRTEVDLQLSLKTCWGASPMGKRRKAR